MTDTENNDTTPKSIPNLLLMSERRPAPPAQGKVKGKDIHAMIVSCMIGKKPRWPAFPAKLHFCEDPTGDGLIYLEDEHMIVTRISPNYVDKLINAYWDKVSTSPDLGIFLGSITADDAVKTRRLWLHAVKAKRDPFPMLTWLSDPRPAHHKVAFDPIPRGDCQAPLWGELMGRTTNSEAVMAWIGSLFDNKSQRQQYVWMYGDGDNGKGTFTRCLAHALGSTFHADNAPERGRVGEHWTMGLVGKRLLVFADCDNPSFVASGFFKSITGEDRLRVNIKNGPIVSLDMPLKVMLTSNEKPEISGAKSNVRRVIYCSIAPINTRFVGNYEAQMLAETPAFISLCWHIYLAVSGGNPRHVFESDDPTELEQVISDNEQEFEAFVDEYLRFDRNENGMLAPDPKGKALFTSGSDMKEAMINAGFPLMHQRKILVGYLERRHGIKRSRTASVRGFHFVTINKG